MKLVYDEIMVGRVVAENAGKFVPTIELENPPLGKRAALVLYGSE